MLGAGLLAFGVAESGFIRTLAAEFRLLRERSGDPVHPALLHAWTGIYLLVVVQLTWSLRPIIGDQTS